MGERNDKLHGMLAFAPIERKYADKVVHAANVLSSESGTREWKLAVILALMDKVEEHHKAGTDECPDNVYNFLMAWLAGCTAYAEDSGFRLSHGVAFMAGAAVVGIFFLIGGGW